jgi:hypothetical protein
MVIWAIRKHRLNFEPLQTDVAKTIDCAALYGPESASTLIKICRNRDKMQ